MINDLKPYPAMKDSGVPWLGKVPEHWGVLRLGGVLRERGETNDDNSVTEVLSVMRERGVIPYAEKGNVGNKKSEDITRYKIVRPGDIVVNCMNVIIGSVGLSKYTGCLSPVYYVLTRRSETDDPAYLNAYFQTKPFQLSLVRIGNGILAHRMRIPMELLKCEPFPRPPANEQADIVRFLDHANRRIRRYIRAKQKLIKLLEEQRQVIIHQAVTRGLDPNVRLKHSGVKWLGEMPTHWDVVRVGRLIQLTTGFPFKSEGFSQSTDDIRLLRGINIAPGRIRWDDVVRWPVSQRGHFIDYELRDGDIVLGMDRPIISGGVRVARIGAADMPALVLQRVARIRPHADLDAGFLILLLQGASFANYLAPIFTGISVPHISPEQICSFRIPFPSPDEQRQIVNWLKVRTATLDASAHAANHEISFLREYRTRLIADVVTGKLDVREAAAKLPDEPEDMAALDTVEDLEDAEDTAEESATDEETAEAAA
jgi:type I restriction enzyme S subunit